MKLPPALTRDILARAGIPPPIVGEKEFMAAVIELAKRNGWRHYHVFDSRKSMAGWPDLVLLKGVCCVIAELKVGNNMPDAAQLSWLESWRMIPGVAVFVWRPADWPAIERLLTGA